MTDFRELVVFSGGKAKKEKSANQDKGFVNEFKAFKEAVKNGGSAEIRNMHIAHIQNMFG